MPTSRNCNKSQRRLLWYIKLRRLGLCATCGTLWRYTGAANIRGLFLTPCVLEGFKRRSPSLLSLSWWHVLHRLVMGVKDTWYLPWRAQSWISHAGRSGYRETAATKDWSDGLSSYRLHIFYELNWSVSKDTRKVIIISSRRDMGLGRLSYHV